MKSKPFHFRKYFIPLFFFFPLLPLAAQEKQIRYYPPEDTLVQQKIGQWQDMKFGLLMHWGPYSQWGVVESWSICSEDESWCYRGTDYDQYKQLYERLPCTFNPTAFDPAKWARAAKDAGMKYMVFTTKHHDGFCMFDTRTTDYRITAANCPFSSNPRADVTKEIFNAFRAEGFMVGAYFSKPDWHSEFFWWPKFATPDRNVNYDITKHPDRWQKFVDFTHAQIDELTTNYGKLDILWLDGGWVHALPPEEKAFYQKLNAESLEHGLSPLKLPQDQDVQMDKIAAKARQNQPGLIVVDRAVEGRNQNYLTPEQTVPSAYLPYPWETCMTMGGSWSYNFQEHYKSARELIHLLADVVSKGGNLLLNVGPGPDGQWHQEAYDRLKEIGDWMKVNHEAIYNTKGMEHFAEGNFRFTRGKNTLLYAIYLASESEVKIPSELTIASIVPQKNSQIRLLGYDHPLKWIKSGNGIRIIIPGSVRVNPPSRYAWVFSISACSPQKTAWVEPIRAFDIDFNWGEGGPNGFAAPGLWADANPEEHIRWYEKLGCNVIQTFAVSCNGYAWYKNGIIPEQPGLKYDFLTEMVKLGHQRNMKVFGYFCVGANTKWGLEHPDLSYGTPSSPHIPFTNQYLDYLCSSIEDALKKTRMDGFMADWIWNPGTAIEPYPPLKWIPCEQVMFSELMNKPFPGIDKITPEIEQDFRRKAIERCWKRIHATAKKTNPDCLIWVTCSQITSKDVIGSAMFKEADLLMNEGGDLASVEAIRNMAGEHTRLMTCLASWNKQDAAVVVPGALKANIGLYGFTKPTVNSLLPQVDHFLNQPVDSFKGDERNIASLARVFHGLSQDYVKK